MNPQWLSMVLRILVEHRRCHDVFTSCHLRQLSVKNCYMSIYFHKVLGISSFLTLYSVIFIVDFNIDQYVGRTSGPTV